MNSETAYLTSYRCPWCHAGLSTWTGQRAEWLRCPKCGRAGLPPDHVQAEPRPKVKPVGGTFVLRPDDRPPLGRTATRSRRRAVSSGGLVRVVLATGIFLSLLLLVFALLDQNTINAALFGIVALVCIGVLVVTARVGRNEP